MAKQGTVKWFSLRQEERIAKLLEGKRSRSSGAAVHDQGDVRTTTKLIECKHTGTFTKPAKSISVKLSDLEKIADEAWSEGKTPVLALAIYAPDSVLSDADGTVNLVLRLEKEDPEFAWRN